jgi:hypothetical protein
MPHTIMAELVGDPMDYECQIYFLKTVKSGHRTRVYSRWMTCHLSAKITTGFLMQIN